MVLLRESLYANATILPSMECADEKYEEGISGAKEVALI